MTVEMSHFSSAAECVKAYALFKTRFIFFTFAVLNEEMSALKASDDLNMSFMLVS